MRHFALTNLKEFGMGKTAIEEKIIAESECLIEVFEEKKGNAPFDTLTFANSSQFLQISLKFVFIHLKLL